MRTRHERIRGATAAIAVGIGVAGLTAPAWADVTLTLQQTAVTTDASQGTPAAGPLPAPQGITLIFHGSDARLEIAGGPVVLYDGKDGTEETLHPTEKTYDMTLLTQVAQANDPLPPGTGSHITTNTHLDLRQTDQTEMIAGVTATKYLVTGSITYSRPASHFGGGRHRHGGGGFPGGGGGFPGGFPFNTGNTVDQDQEGGDGEDNGDGRHSRPALPSFSIAGELWLSDAVKLPPDKNATPLPAIQLAAASAGPFLQPLTDALNKKKELPLLARITVTRTGPAPGGEDAAGATPTITTTATTMTVQTVSPAPVAEGLFEAPTDYRLVAAPPMPFDPGTPPATVPDMDTPLAAP